MNIKKLQYSMHSHEQKMNKLNLHVHSHFRDIKDLDKTRIRSDEDAVV
jgi:hypothetical protein